MADSLYDFNVTRLDGSVESMDTYRGQVLLIVNTASECGFTPQYEGLQKLHAELHGRDFAVLGFPCNQFGGQEPGDSTQIGAFCQKNYGVEFPMFAKVEVNGDEAHPLFRFLKAKAPGALGTEFIKWNFTKFLIDREGRVVDRFAPTTKPEELKGQIEALL